jgi:glycyl-tRNA synthetase
MDNTQKIISLCKRRGFVFPSSEIYGGFSSTYDYGPLGAEILRKVRNLWWKNFVIKREEVFGMDGAVFCHPRTWEASGHVKSFNDPLVEDKVTHIRYRADHLIEEKLGIDVSQKSFDELNKILKDNNIKSPDNNELTELKTFNLLVQAEIGSTMESKEKVYMRGETCQNIFLQYLNILNSTRAKIPFGIAQIGKSFRNEITTKDFIYRMREFEQMEMEYFVNPKDGMKWYDYWETFMLLWITENLGLSKESFRYREIPPAEMSHYAKKQKDFEFLSSSGKWFELSPLNHRGDWDLKSHMEYSGANMIYTDQETGEKFIPNVIEISMGLDRILYALLDNAYSEDGDRVVLKLHKNIAPYDVAVFPLVKNKLEIVSKAREIHNSLVDMDLTVSWDDRGNVGKRYYSQDEIGTPKCITVDYQTLDDDTVTVRDRDTTNQIRVNIKDLKSNLLL